MTEGSSRFPLITGIPKQERCGLPSRSFRGSTPSKGYWRRFLPILRPHRPALFAAVVAMMLDAALTVMRPWPLKVVIDRVLSHKASRVPFLHSWLDSSAHTPMQILWGACAATFLIALGTGVFTYFFTRTLGNIGHRYQEGRRARAPKNLHGRGGDRKGTRLNPR